MIRIFLLLIVISLPAQAHKAKEPCVIGGCGGQLCTLPDKDGNPMPGVCWEKPGDACYRAEGTACEKQPDGTCGWTMTDALKECLTKAEEEDKQRQERNRGRD
jgi:hypothetical protein